MTPIRSRSEAVREARERAIRLVEAGEPKVMVARRVRRSRMTVWRWHRDYRAAREAIGVDR